MFMWVFFTLSNRSFIHMMTVYSTLQVGRLYLAEPTSGVIATVAAYVVFTAIRGKNLACIGTAANIVCRPTLWHSGITSKIPAPVLEQIFLILIISIVIHFFRRF